MGRGSRSTPTPTPSASAAVAFGGLTKTLTLTSDPQWTLLYDFFSIPSGPACHPARWPWATAHPRLGEPHHGSLGRGGRDAHQFYSSSLSFLGADTTLFLFYFHRLHDLMSLSLEKDEIKGEWRPIWSGKFEG